MTLAEILHGSAYGRDLFSRHAKLIEALENEITVKATPDGKQVPYVKCVIRDKEIKLTPEEVVRQLYTKILIDDYGYPKERITYEFPVHFGRETKRADIVIRDAGDFTVPYIIVEVNNQAAEGGRELLKSFTIATGASMAVWTNGNSTAYYQHKTPSCFEDIKDIPKNS